MSQFRLSTSVHAPWKFAPESWLGLGLASAAPPAFEGELHLSLFSSIAARYLFATVDAGFAGSDYVTMIGLSLRKAAIVAGSRFR